MKKFIPVLVAALVVACLPTTTPIPGLPTPTAVIQNTSTSAPTETASPLPTVTLAPATSTATPVVASPVVESTATASPLPPPNLTATFPTSTGAPAGASNTPTLVPGQPSLTPTLGILKYGTLPPSVPFTNITLLNRSKRQAYISLQVTTIEGYYTIIEYPVAGKVKIKVPLGSYVYVAWVGGNQMTGSFRLSASDSAVITLYKDKVVVTK